MAEAVTPKAGLASQVVTGGQSIAVFPVSPGGGFITNPPEATESLFVDAVANAGVTAQGTTFELAPGQTWSAIPGQTTQTTVNAVTDAHVFSAVYW